RINRRKSQDDLRARWDLHLEPFFGHLRAMDVSSTLIDAYVDGRLGQDAAPATINREMSALKRMFRLGYYGGGQRGVGCKVEDGELGIDVDGFPDGALELKHGSGVHPIVAGDGYHLDDGTAVAGAIEGDGDGA